MKSISEETHNNIVALLNNGLSSYKIAAQLGISHATVDQKVRVGSQQNLQYQTSVGWFVWLLQEKQILLSSLPMH